MKIFLKFMLKIAIITTCVYCVIIWLIPVKKSVTLKALEEYSDNNTVILCEGSQVTDHFWEVIDFYGEKNIRKHIQIVGYTPEKILKSELYNYMNNRFIFIGNMSDNDSETFISTDWEVIGDIERNHEIIPFPKKLLNYYEIEIK